MHIRPFKYDDIPALVTMTIECDVTDPLANYLLKDIDKYPTSHRRGIYHFVRSKITGSGCDITYVLESDPEDYETAPDSWTRQSEREIIGVATWQRHGTSEVARKWQRIARGSIVDQVNRILVAVEDSYNSFFPSLNPCFSIPNLQAVESLENKEWDPEVFDEYWSLHFPQVFPAWQRRGLARKLMNVVLDIAQDEVVPVVVSSSPLGSLAYQGVGFQSIGLCGCDKLFDELEYGGDRMQLWVWEPELPQGWKGSSDWAGRARRRRETRLMLANNNGGTNSSSIS